nr:MAG TPA: hypothetical protein [Caudoviricetes sp.]
MYHTLHLYRCYFYTLCFNYFIRETRIYTYFH